MATSNSNLQLIGYTYTSSSSPNTNYANANPLRLSQTYGEYGEYKTILQFDVSNAIKSSKINSASLNFKLQLHEVYGAGTANVNIKHSAGVTNGYIYNSITHSNFQSLIAQSVKESVECRAGRTDAYNNQIDITSSVANNIQDGVLTIVLESLYASLIIDSNSITLSVNYEEVDPVVPLVVAPNGTYENRSRTIKFEWIYKSQTEAMQASAALEYRKGTSGSYTIINVYSKNNYYVMQANMLLEGVYEWRVRTTDTDGKVSDYAYGSFTVIDRPSVPIITNVENKCISTITWSSGEQIAFEFEVYRGDNVEFSKKVSSSANNYKPNMFFANTTYTIRIRVCNIYGLWSEWGSKVFTFTFTNPPKPSITVSPMNHEVVIKSNVVGAIVYKSENKSYYVPVGKVTDKGLFIDYNVANNKMYRYFVRSYVDGYTDSDIQLAQVTIKGVVLQSDLGYVNLKMSQNQYMNYSKTIQTDKVINKYSGRQYGVAEFSDFRTKEIALTSALTQDELETLEKLYYSNEILVYKDFRGNKFYCVIGSLAISHVIMNYYNVDLSIQQIDSTEEVSVYE